MEAQNISGPDIQQTTFSRASRVEQTVEVPQENQSREARVSADTVKEEGKGASIDTYA